MRKWKKLITVALVAVMTLSLAACGSKEESSEGKDSAEKKDGYTIGATYYTLETEFCMRMDNYAKKYCE